MYISMLERHLPELQGLDEGILHELVASGLGVEAK